MTQQIDDYHDRTVGSGATAAEVASAERTLGVELPLSYRAFLSRYGWARFAHDELYGLGADIPEHLNLTVNAHVEWSSAQPNMKRTLVPVLNDGSGNHFCLATDLMEKGECPVVFWDHDEDENQQPAVEGDSFDAWIIGYLADL